MSKKTFYHLVLDKSGSMDSCWSEARQVFNSQIQKFRSIKMDMPNSEIYFSYCAFNQALSFSESIKPIDHAYIDWGTIYPEGMTSLYDAIGESIRYLKEKIGLTLEEKETDVIMLILTDGFENSSKKFSGLSLKHLMNSMEETGKWNFLFLGAGLDIAKATSELGLMGKNSFSFHKEKLSSSMEDVNEEIETFLAQKSQNNKKAEFFEDLKFKKF